MSSDDDCLTFIAMHAVGRDFETSKGKLSDKGHGSLCCSTSQIGTEQVRPVYDCIRATKRTDRDREFPSRSDG